MNINEIPNKPPFHVYYLVQKYGFDYDGKFWTTCHGCGKKIEVYPGDWFFDDKYAECKDCHIDFDWFSDQNEREQFLKQQEEYYRNHLALVTSTGRAIFLTKQLESEYDGQRWLCTDFEKECHPCYNLNELTIKDYRLEN